MKITEEDIITIIEGSATLFERREGFSVKKPPEDKEFQILIKKWSSVANLNNDNFNRILNWEGLDVNKLKDLSGHIAFTGKFLPSWALLLKDSVEYFLSYSMEDILKNEKRPDFVDPLQPLPFEELFIPFVYFVSDRLEKRTGKTWNLLSPQAQNKLKRTIFVSLSTISSQPLYTEFSLLQYKRTHGFSGLDMIMALAETAPAKEIYNEFILNLHKGDFIELLKNYSSLARAIGVTMDLWIDSHAEMLERLEKDLPEIREAFFCGRDAGTVTDIKPFLSDPHRNRRSVAELTFSSDKKIMYKPKDNGIDKAFYSFLEWFNSKGITPSFKAPVILDRFDYGWVEFIRHMACKDKEEAENFYRRAGMILCLVYALDGIDNTCDNLIAHGEHPLLIDLETLMHPRWREKVTEGVHLPPGREHMSQSVLRTGLLPRWQIKEDGNVAYDISAFAGIHDQETSYTNIFWEHINTDIMFLSSKKVNFHPGPNVLYLKDTPVHPRDYTDEILHGFKYMYSFLLKHREEIIERNGPLERFKEKKVRFVFRNTSDYWRVLQMLLKSESLRNGTEQTIQSALLWRIFKDDTEKPYFFNLIASERKSLFQGDVPYFSAYTDTTSLEVDRERISSFFIEPSFDLVVKRLQKLDNSDMELQVSYIKNALYSRVAKDTHVLTETLPEISLDHVKIFSEKSFLEKAIEIGEEIRKLAVIDRDKHITWIAPQYIEKIERYQLSPLGYELYGGTSGVALFMSALASVTGLEWCRTMALGAINLLRRELQEKNTDTSIPDNIGGTTGIGSLIYAFVSISRFLEEKELLLDAVKLAGLITKELVDRDTKYDVIAGSAGAILGLLSLHRILPDSPALNKALLCGKHLVENRKSWPSVEGNRMTGFSHGLAGIALSLLKLYSFTGEEEFLEGAVKAIEEENSIFDSENNNWPHFVKFPSMVKKGFWVTWCHGGPGIGLARLGGLSVYDTDQMRKDIDIALNITGKFLLSHIDHICCGNFGRNELLVTASKKFSDDHLLSKARSQASWIIEHRKEKGYFNLDMKFAGGAFNPGLFKGTSGIGYQLLRLIYPDRIPSLLLWE